jgi:squalene cyclase
MMKHFHRYGNWGVCFTYATWFALRGLATVGKTYNNCPAMRKAVDFLLKAQRDNGGWGESYLSCPNKVMFLLRVTICIRMPGSGPIETWV